METTSCQGNQRNYGKNDNHDHILPKWCSWSYSVKMINDQWGAISGLGQPDMGLDTEKCRIAGCQRWKSEGCFGIRLSSLKISISSNLVYGRLLPLLKLIYFSMAAIYFGWSSYFIIINKIVILIIVVKVTFIVAGHIYQRRGRLSKITKISPDFDKRGRRLFELATLLELHPHLPHFFLISKCPHWYWAWFYKQNIAKATTDSGVDCFNQINK